MGSSGPAAHAWTKPAPCIFVIARSWSLMARSSVLLTCATHRSRRAAAAALTATSRPRSAELVWRSRIALGKFRARVVAATRSRSSPGTSETLYTISSCSRLNGAAAMVDRATVECSRELKPSKSAWRAYLPKGV